MKNFLLTLIGFLFFMSFAMAQQDSIPNAEEPNNSTEPAREAPLEFTPAAPTTNENKSPASEEVKPTEEAKPAQEAPTEYTPSEPTQTPKEPQTEAENSNETTGSGASTESDGSNNQGDDYASSTAAAGGDKEISDFRPVLSLSGGMLTFFGDVTNSQKANGALTSNLAFDFKVSFPLKSSFYVSLRSLYGKISANERSTDFNRNFSSSFNSFGVEFSYNFNHFLAEKRIIDPFFAVGAEAIIFNSKTDLIYGKTEEYYHYWQDGSIRNQEEIPENFATASVIPRDYDYETDIRESDITGVGFYEKYSFMVPVTFGGNMRLTHRMHMKLAVSYNFLFTDMLDGVSKDGKGVYKGSGKMDGILYSSVGLSFDLSDHGRKEKEDAKYTISDEELAEMTLGDEDGDGVRNLDDMCLGTPAGVEVDSVGCPPDTDKDGVPDYRDVEVNSPENSVVDSNGLALTDEQIEMIYIRYLDSTGHFAAIEDTIYTKDMPTKTERRMASKFSVQVEGEALTEEQANKLLEEDKIKSVPDGAKETILVGEFDDIKDAIEKKKELKKEGIQTSAIVEERATGKVITADTRGVFVGAATAKALEKQSGTVFRIQVGAFRNPVGDDAFKDIRPVVGVKSSDGLTRYYSGNYSTYAEASAARAALKEAGYGDCMVKGFSAGEAVQLEAVGGSGTTATPGGNTTPANVPSKAESKEVKFKIQLGSFREKIPMDIFNKYLKLGNISHEKVEDGLTRYYVGPFDGYEQAKAFRAELDELDIPGAFIVGEYQGTTIPAKQALDMIK